MLLDIQPIHDNSCNCFEDLIITVANWVNRPYHFMFADSWSFGFEDTDFYKSDPIGPKIRISAEETIKTVEHFMGIEIIPYHMETFEETYSIIKARLTMNLPVIISVDSFWIPWDPEYQKNHHKYHVCLVVGIDDNNQSLICTDPFWALKKEVEFPFEDYQYGFGPCRVIEIGEIGEIGDIDYFEMIKERLRRLRVKVSGLNTFESINKFAEYIEKSNDLSSEFKDYGIVWNSPLIFKLNSVINGRRKFSNFLRYISLNKEINFLLSFSEDLLLAASKWDTVKSLLIKGSFAGFNENLRSKISNLIKDIAKYEENIAKSLGEQIESPVETKFSYMKSVDKSIQTKTNRDTIYINLSEYFNNKGFGSTVSLDCEADLTGTGEYFLMNELSNNKIWNTNDFSFIFPSLKDIKYDNISCDEQFINIPKGIYESITFLGCSEFGNSSGTLIIKNDSDVEERITMSFSDWALNPVFDEVIVWNGKAVRKDGKTAEIMSKFDFKILAKQYLINCRKEVNSLILPYCPNMHVFAISLSKLIE